MKIFEGKNIPIKSWCNNPEEGAIDQAKNLASLPFAFKHISLMPDTHQGYGMPIGGVLATKGVIIPNAVGVDIGCGMCAVRTSLPFIKQEEITEGEVIAETKSAYKFTYRWLGFRCHQWVDKNTFSDRIEFIK